MTDRSTAAMDGTLLERYEPVIGLEVHVQLSTASKIFCACSTRYGAPPNTQVCPVCLGYPGTLPVLNERAVELAVVAALALGCEVHETSIFARKHYFYPDLPKGYQISQYDLPLCIDGKITFQVDGEDRTAGITRVHIEEDTGRLVHDDAFDGTATLVDLNRSLSGAVTLSAVATTRYPSRSSTLCSRSRLVGQAATTRMHGGHECCT